MYKVFFRNEKDVKKAVKKYPKKVKKQISAAIEELKKNPRTPNCVSCSRMVGYDCYKSKVGNYRIIYDINEDKKQIEIIMIGDRRYIYEDFGRKYKPWLDLTPFLFLHNHPQPDQIG